MANKSTFLALLVLSFILISGCVNVNVRQKVTADGKMTGSISGTLDLTDMYLSSGVPVENFSLLDETMQKSICSNLTSSGNLSRSTCKVYNGVVTVTGEFKEQNLTEEDGFFKSYGLLNTEYLLVGNTSEITGGQDSGIDIGALIQAKKRGAKIDYIIEMPGDVYEVGGGRMLNETDKYDRHIVVAKFDFISVLTNGDRIYVRSREPSYIGPVLISLMGFALAFVPLVLRWVIHPKRDKSLYKDGLGVLWTVLQVIGILFLNFLVMMASIIYGLFPDQWFVGAGLLLFTALELYSVYVYLSFDFEVTKDGLFAKQNFVERRFKFSEIKKVERAEVDSIFMLGDWNVRTPSGAKVHPSETWFNGHAGRKGILMQMRNGRMIYVIVKDIDWVMDSLKGKV